MGDISRFTNAPPFQKSKKIAQAYNCDLSIPNGPGIGNVLCYTPLVRQYALKKGRRLKLLSAPIKPFVGKSDMDLEDYPVWKNNPYVKEIIETNEIVKINKDKDDACQFSHVIENLCFAYECSTTKLKPYIYLSFDEKAWAIDYLSKFKRPIICMHPYGKSAPQRQINWYEDNWNKLIASFPEFSFIKFGLHGNDCKTVNAYYPNLTLRQTFSLIWASDFFIGFDSGLAHAATAFEKKAIVLWDVVPKEILEQKKEMGFGGAMMLRWSYPQNRNLMLLGEREDEIFEICCDSIKNFFI